MQWNNAAYQIRENVDPDLKQMPLFGIVQCSAINCGTLETHHQLVPTSSREPYPIQLI